MASRDLMAFRNHCRSRAKRPGADPWWSILADEVDGYLHQPDPDPEPEPDDAADPLF